MRSKWMAPIGIVAMLIFGAVVYSRLPDQVPTHWNIYGQVDTMMDRLQAVLLLPALTAGLWLLMLGLPRIDPLRASYAAFAGTYQLFVNALVLFMLALYVVSLGAALGWNINVPQMIGIGVGLLFMLLGNEMGRLKPNWFAGIRTPWTLSDPEIWRRTHRFGVVPGCDHPAPDPRVDQHPHGARQDGFAADVDERLRAIVGERAQARFSFCAEDHGGVGHATAQRSSPS